MLFFEPRPIVPPLGKQALDLVHFWANTVRTFLEALEHTPALIQGSKKAFGIG